MKEYSVLKFDAFLHEYDELFRDIEDETAIQLSRQVLTGEMMERGPGGLSDAQSPPHQFSVLHNLQLRENQMGETPKYALGIQLAGDNKSLTQVVWDTTGLTNFTLQRKFKKVFSVMQLQSSGGNSALALMWDYKQKFGTWGGKWLSMNQDYSLSYVRSLYPVTPGKKVRTFMGTELQYENAQRTTQLRYLLAHNNSERGVQFVGVYSPSSTLRVLGQRKFGMSTIFSELFHSNANRGTSRFRVGLQHKFVEGSVASCFVDHGLRLTSRMQLALGQRMQILAAFTWDPNTSKMRCGFNLTCSG